MTRDELATKFGINLNHLIAFDLEATPSETIATPEPKLRKRVKKSKKEA